MGKASLREEADADRSKAWSLEVGQRSLGLEERDPDRDVWHGAQGQQDTDAVEAEDAAGDPSVGAKVGRDPGCPSEALHSG